MTNESTLKSFLCRLLRQAFPQAIVDRHEDLFTSGYPDITFTWKGTTTWIEAKHDRDYVRMKSKGIQNLKCRLLAKQGSCFYVIWEDRKNKKRTLIIDPWNYEKGRILNEEKLPKNCVSEGFNHDLVIEYLRGIHGNHDQ